MSTCVRTCVREMEQLRHFFDPVGGLTPPKGRQGHSVPTPRPLPLSSLSQQQQLGEKHNGKVGGISVRVCAILSVSTKNKL